LEGYRDQREVKQIQIMPGDMTIKSSLLGEILEKLAGLRMNITIRLDDDREEGDPVCSALIFQQVTMARKRDINDTDDDEEGLVDYSGDSDVIVLLPT